MWLRATKSAARGDQSASDSPASSTHRPACAAGTSTHSFIDTAHAGIEQRRSFECERLRAGFLVHELEHHIVLPGAEGDLPGVTLTQGAPNIWLTLTAG